MRNCSATFAIDELSLAGLLSNAGIMAFELRNTVLCFACCSG